MPNNARPLNFRVSDWNTDNLECEIVHQTHWESSTRNIGDLNDVQQREHIRFNVNPVGDMPCYGQPALLPFGMVVDEARFEVNKTIGTMEAGGGRDKHSGAGQATLF